MEKPNAFVLTGMFLVLCRSPLYLRELTRRGIKPLVITQAKFRKEALACQADPEHPASLIHEFAFINDSAGEASVLGEVLAAGSRWRDAYTIVAAYAVGETLVEPTGLLADALGVPTAGLRATRACRNKALQRWYMPDLSPRSIVVSAGERDTMKLADVPFPAVVKPVGRMSSSGVASVRDADELRRQLATYPAGEVILIEERVVGQEYSVETLIQGGKAIFASVTRKDTTESQSESFVELAHTVPSDLAGPQAILLEANQKMLDVLHFEDGMTHSEWRVDAAGRPLLMEVAARPPGDGLMALYHLVTGVPMEPEIIRLALGEKTVYSAPARFARQVYLEHKTDQIGSVLTDVSLDWPGVEPIWAADRPMWPAVEPGSMSDPPTLRAVHVLKARGTVLGPLQCSSDRSVTFFIDAQSPAELDALERRVRDALTVHTAPARTRRAERPESVVSPS